MGKGELHVRILEGRNVKDMDSIGTGDPYVEFWIDGHEKQKTEVRHNTNSPVWLKETTYPVKGENFLHLRLLDDDIGTDDKIGESKIELGPVYKNYYQDTWVPVVHSQKSKEVNGEVHVVLEYFPK
ncbi:hypothetical protein G9A89_009175 [Geosiphon pyriformis]|nr:hypothetical protein G9A89_009175 [Geosiphon pyriformis]